MNDIKTTGLDREGLHDPLLKKLHSLSKGKELRLAQAASYALAALHGIPNNESLHKALFRHKATILNGVAKVAGSVATMVPSKLLNGLPDLQDLPELVASMVEAIVSLSGIVHSLGSAVESVRSQYRSYVALRFADMLIQSHAFVKLEDFLGKVPCYQDTDFLCGVFAHNSSKHGKEATCLREKRYSYFSNKCYFQLHPSHPTTTSTHG